MDMRITQLLYGMMLIIGSLFFIETSTVMAEDTLTVKEGTWTPLNESKQHGMEQDIVESDYTLEGLKDQYETFYEVPLQGAGENSELKLHVSYSDLLKPNSSITILIDGVPVKSVSLDNKKRTAEVNIPLKKEHLEPGFHTIGVSFYGHMTEDMCVNEENAANWLTIQAKSSVFIEGTQEDTYTNLLEMYPYPFIEQTRSEATQATIVLPNEPSDDELSAALQIAHALREEAVTDSAVPIEFEKDIEEINTHIIAIGEEGAWETDIATLMKQAELDTPKGEVSFSTHAVDDGKSVRGLLLITGKEDAPLASHVRILTDVHLSDQLSGDAISIATIPPVEEHGMENSYTFDDMDMGNVELSGLNRMSQTYFLRLPERMMYEEHAVLHVRMKVAETLRKQVNSPYHQNERAELVIQINDVPHSVAIDDLEKGADEAFYEIDIPVDPKTFQKNPYMQIQLIGHGLRENIICAPEQEDRWIYIDETSSFTLPKKIDQQTGNFSAWPYPFAKNGVVDTLLVIPNDMTKEDITSLHNLTDTLSHTTRLDGIEILSTKQVETGDLENRNVLFVGNMEEHDDLLENMDQLLIQQDETGSLDVAAYQFVNETAAFVSWIQPSVWNEDYTMAVFAPVQADDDRIVSRRLLDYMDSTPLEPYIVVETNHGEIFSQEKEEQKEAPDDVEDANESKERLNGWYIAGFIGIVIVSVVALLFLYRKRKKE